MTTINKTKTGSGSMADNPGSKAFYLSAGFNLPGRNGRRLTLTFNAAVTVSEPPSG